MSNFSSVVAAAIRLGQDGACDLARVIDIAREFEVALVTVLWWSKGTAVPHPRLQKQVLEYMVRSGYTADNGDEQ